MIKQKVLTLLVLLAAVVTGARAAWTGGTYTATANENLNAITVSDDATLTINQGVTVTVSGGIVVADGKTLTITGGGTLVANGANGANGGTGQTGNAGGTAIAGNVIINGVGLTVTATGGQGGQGGQGAQGGKGSDGSDGEGGEDGGLGGDGARGGDGGSAFSGAVTIYAGSVTATGGKGGNGGKGGTGGTGGTGGLGSDGGQGGQGGDGGNGGNGGHAFAGTLTVYGGNVSAYGGQEGNGGEEGDGGYGGEGGFDGYTGELGDIGEMSGDDGDGGVAYANNVTFEAATYTVKDDSGYPINLNNITSELKVIIQSADVELVVPYSVALADGTEDATNWTITPAEATTTGVAAGTEVKATYSGTKHVKSVKAVKKAQAAAYTMAAAATSADKGKLICADGHIHANGADAACTKARVAKIIYIGTTGHATYSHGLALALTDEGQMAWGAAMTACNTTKNTNTPVTDATWLLASKDQWNYMKGINGAGSASALRTGFEDVSGTNMVADEYWSSTEDEDDCMWVLDFNMGVWNSCDKSGKRYVRSALAF